MIIDFINESGNRTIIINPDRVTAVENSLGPAIEIAVRDTWSNMAFKTVDERNEAMELISYHLKIGTKYLVLK